MNKACPRSRSGFTMVELLMVVLIIGMLMALLLPAIGAVQRGAKNAAIKMGIEQLAIPLGQAKAKFGGYPPDPNWTANAIKTYFLKAFPRYTPTVDDITAFRSLSEAEVLVFWLGGHWDRNRMRGFLANPTGSPFPRHDSSGNLLPPVIAPDVQRTTPFFEFEETRLYDADKDGYPEYYASGTTPANSAPFVYFAARNGSYTTIGRYEKTNPPDGDADFTASDTTQGVARPYRKNTSGGFIKPNSYQIIHAGLDNHFGAGFQVFPSGIIGDDQDNITNFGARTLGDSD